MSVCRPSFKSPLMRARTASVALSAADGTTTSSWKLYVNELVAPTLRAVQDSGRTDRVVKVYPIGYMLS